MNFSHAFLSEMLIEGEPVSFFGHHLQKAFGDKVRSAVILGLAYPNSYNSYEPIKDGKWDYLFETYTSKNIGFSLDNSPFGLESFDMWPYRDTVNHPSYNTVFTDLLFYKSIDEHLLSTGWTGYFADDFKDEFYRRFNICKEVKNLSYDATQLKQVMEYLDTIRQSKYAHLDDLRLSIDKWAEN